MNHQVIKKSNSGSTKLVDNVYFEITKPNTYASSVLLKNYYSELDEDNVKSIANRMRMIGFSRTYLSKLKVVTGVLTCSYCDKPNLIIELDGMRVPNAQKACGKCNSKKSNKSLETFLSERNIQKSNIKIYVP